MPLPPGSGSGAYAAIIDEVLIPAFEAFKPNLVCVIVLVPLSVFECVYLSLMYECVYECMSVSFVIYNQECTCFLFFFILLCFDLFCPIPVSCALSLSLPLRSGFLSLLLWGFRFCLLLLRGVWVSLHDRCDSNFSRESTLNYPS